MGKIPYKRYRVSGSYIKANEASGFVLFQHQFLNEKFDIEIAVDGKATVQDICKYTEKRFGKMDGLRILSVEYLGSVDFVDLGL